MSDLVPLPPKGRRFTSRRRVRLAEVNPEGRLRLDALARYLQDVAADDARDAGFPGDVTWVVRRVVVEIDRLPDFDDEVVLTTFCSGSGSRWAERRTSLAGPRAKRAEAAALWVSVDKAGRPVALPERFFEVYGEATAGRRVGSRLSHPGPGQAQSRRPWPLRATDFDVLGHMNNAAYWEAVEDELADAGRSRPLRRAELELRTPIEPHDDVELASVRSDDGRWWLWLVGGDTVHASARMAEA